MESSATTTASLLPPGFQALEGFVAHWDVETSHARWQRRSEASMAQILAFYNTILPLADQALSHVESFPLDRLPDDAARLMRLLLALTQAAIAVEYHGQPRAAFTPYPHALRIADGMSPWG